MDKRDKAADENKGYTPEEGNKNSENNESREPSRNLKWDQAQRRQQAGPRSYNESIETQNISNQNTEADKEQIDTQEKNDPNNPHDIGDQISERQQTIDEKNSQRKEER